MCCAGTPNPRPRPRYLLMFVCAVRCPTLTQLARHAGPGNAALDPHPLARHPSEPCPCGFDIHVTFACSKRAGCCVRDDLLMSSRRVPVMLVATHSGELPTPALAAQVDRFRFISRTAVFGPGVAQIELERHRADAECCAVRVRLAAAEKMLELVHPDGPRSIEILVTQTHNLR
eukprot:1926394-Rhodomonas_salina.4